jgi:hypothetical protein
VDCRPQNIAPILHLTYLFISKVFFLRELIMTVYESEWVRSISELTQLARKLERLESAEKRYKQNGCIVPVGVTTAKTIFNER